MVVLPNGKVLVQAKLTKELAEILEEIKRQTGFNKSVLVTLAIQNMIESGKWRINKAAE